MAKHKFKSMDTRERINFVAKIASVVFSIGMLGLIGVNVSNYSIASAANQSELKDLENQLNNIQDRSVTQEEAVVILNSAADAGNALAKLQTDCINFGDFDKESASVYLDSSQSVVPWYQTSNYTNLEWEFNTNYSFTMDEVPALWTLYADIVNDMGSVDKTLFAYVTATYHVEDNQFTNVSVNITASGKAAVVKDSSGNYNVDSGIDTEPDSVFTDSDGVALTYLDGIWFEPDWTPRYIYDESSDTLIAYSAQKYQSLYHKSLSDIEFPGSDATDTTDGADGKGVTDNENNPE